MATGRAAGAGRLVAVVVTHDRLEQLKTTIAALLEEPGELLAGLVVVDNASTDATAAFLGGIDDPRLDVVRLDRNHGGAGGFAAGLQRAAEAWDADWTVVMDDDARPHSGALSEFHRRAGDGWDAAAAAVFYPGGAICEMNRPSRNPFWHGAVALRSALRGRDGFHLAPDDYDAGPVQVDVASFVGLFLSRRALSLAGIPDGRLFLYGDDGLYTLGLTRAGGRIGFLPSVRFEHDCRTLSRGAGGRFRPLWKVYYYHRNLLLLYRMAAGPLFWPVLPLVLAKWLAKARHHGGERRVFLRLMRLAVADGLRRRLDVPHDEVLRLARGGSGRHQVKSRPMAPRSD